MPPGGIFHPPICTWSQKTYAAINEYRVSVPNTGKYFIEKAAAVRVERAPMVQTGQAVLQSPFGVSPKRLFKTRTGTHHLPTNITS